MRYVKEEIRGCRQMLSNHYRADSNCLQISPSLSKTQRGGKILLLQKIIILKVWVVCSFGPTTTVWVVCENYPNCKQSDKILSEFENQLIFFFDAKYSQDGLTQERSVLAQTCRRRGFKLFAVVVSCIVVHTMLIRTRKTLFLERIARL